MDNSARDLEIAALYAGGPGTAAIPASKLAQKFGLSVPQIRRIVAEVVKCPSAPKPTSEEKVLSSYHIKLGNRLYAYRFALPNDSTQASNELGWSVKKLRSIEQGRSEITVSDLKAMAEYMRTTISILTENL